MYLDFKVQQEHTHKTYKIKSKVYLAQQRKRPLLLTRAEPCCPQCRHGVVAVALTGPTDHTSLVLLLGLASLVRVVSPGQTLLLVACLFPSATAGGRAVALLVQLSVKWQTQHSNNVVVTFFFVNIQLLMRYYSKIKLAPMVCVACSCGCAK
jgi:hypothetical protein